MTFERLLFLQYIYVGRIVGRKWGAENRLETRALKIRDVTDDSRISYARKTRLKKAAGISAITDRK